MPVRMKFHEIRSSLVPACSVSALMPNFVIAKSIWEGKLSMRKFDTSRAMFKPDGTPLYSGYKSAQTLYRVGLFGNAETAPAPERVKPRIARATLKRIRSQ